MLRKNFRSSSPTSHFTRHTFLCSLFIDFVLTPLIAFIPLDALFLIIIWLVFSEVDEPVFKKPCTQPEIEQLLEFGRELYSLSQRINADKVVTESNQKMLEVS